LRYSRGPLAYPRFLALAAPLGVLAVTGAGGCSALFPSDTHQQPTTIAFPVHPIRVDTVGYLPERAKVATITQPPTGATTFTADATFNIIDANTNGVAWDGPITGPQTDNQVMGAAVQVWTADFSAFNTPGQYYLSVDGVGQSAPFTIAPDVFADAFMRAMTGMYGQRCGTDVTINLDGNKWSHGACHTHDALMTVLTGSNTIVPSLHGWHDAGDYGKYTGNGAFSAGMLLQAWEQFSAKIQPIAVSSIPEHGGPLPDFLAEVKWELDWLLTTQQADGSAVHKVTAKTFEGFVMPEQDGQQRFYVPIGTVATADLTAVMALASRLYQPYDQDLANTYLTAAMNGYAFLTAHPGIIQPDQSMFSTGGYTDSTDNDDRAWAAAELWVTTGDPTALADFEARVGTNPQVSIAWDWSNTANLGYFSYLLSTRDGRTDTVVSTLGAAVVSAGDSIATQASHAAYGRGLSQYYWGSNGTVARLSMNLWAAYKLNNQDPKYLDAIQSQLDHLLGRNVYDRSQVTAIGYHPPLSPHHRPSAADGIQAPWPGLLVGGSWPTESNWTDQTSDDQMNEIAINWVAPFAFATAALLPDPPAAN
jgi:endoglucanase